jgi:diguanylate cyclase
MQDAFYRELIQQSPIGWTYNKILCDELGKPYDYEFIEVNPAFCKISGLQAADVVGKRLSEAIPGILERDPHWVEVVGNIALNGGTGEVENYFSTLGKWYRVTIFSPQKYYFVTQVTDISQDFHNRAELLDSLGAAIYVADIQNHEILFINGKGREQWGEIVGRTCWKTLRQGLDGPCAYCTNPKLLDEHGEPNGIHEWEYFDKDSGRWFRGYDSAIRWTGRSNIARMSMILDITQLKQTEARLRESEERYRLLADVTFEGVFIHNHGIVLDL